MNVNLFCEIFLVLLVFVQNVYSWQYFTTMDMVFKEFFVKQDVVVHSEYRYGNCKDREILKYYNHVHIKHLDILGKVIVRGYIDVMRIPTCIVLRATSYEEDLFRTTAYNFQLCVPRVSYCHTHFRFKYHYYEWYIPLNFYGGMNWDMYFFGPQFAKWA